METKKELTYRGLVINGFLALLVTIALFAASIISFIKTDTAGLTPLAGIILLALAIFCIIALF